jgi:hypothetical protein
MEKNELLKTFVNEEGSLMFIVKKNNFKFYLSIFLVVLSIVASLSFLYGWEAFHIEESQVNFGIFLFLTFVIPTLLYYEYYKSQKEQFLILSVSILSVSKGTKFDFQLKKANRNKTVFLNLREYGIISISKKNDNEILLVTERKLPWGNRKLVISDEFKDRKEEVLEFLKLSFLNKNGADLITTDKVLD